VIGQHGHAVIIGRGAQFILAPDRTLRVRVIAPLEQRASRVAENLAIDLGEARARVLQKDGERLAFARAHFNRDVRAPEQYDLLINTANVEVEQAAVLIEEAFTMRFGHHWPRAPGAVRRVPTERRPEPSGPGAERRVTTSAHVSL
jgi:cytidylate kinase